MSYRAFKRLLGETSLERKCRFMFGSGVVVLIFLSFSLYDYLTVHLAYDQAVTTCRLLVAPTVAQNCLTKTSGNLDKVLLKEPGKEYQYHFLSNKGDDSFETELYKQFLRGEGKADDYRQRDQVLLYYAPIRVANECMSCHQAIAKKKGQEALADNGGVQTRIEASQAQQADRTTSVDQLISSETSADLPATIVKLNQTQTAYQAALQSAANIMRLSLLDYIK